MISGWTCSFIWCRISELWPCVSLFQTFSSAPHYYLVSSSLSYNCIYRGSLPREDKLNFRCTSHLPKNPASSRSPNSSSELKQLSFLLSSAHARIFSLWGHPDTSKMKLTEKTSRKAQKDSENGNTDISGLHWTNIFSPNICHVNNSIWVHVVRR